MFKISKIGITVPYHATSGCEQDATVPKRPRSPERNSSPVEDCVRKPTFRVASVPVLTSRALLKDESSLPLKKRMKRSESTMFLLEEHTAELPKATAAKCDPGTKPEDYLRSIVKGCAVSLDSVKIDLESFFPIAKQQHSSYAQAALAARNEDLLALQKLHREGSNLQCSNRFGESIIHIVCRRGRDDILKFLVKDAGVTLRLRDDLGRTPFHDAAWTERPNFKLVTILLKEEPDLLFVKDNRGNSPLAYIPKEHWGVWNHFLKCNTELFLGTVSKEERLISQ